MADSRTSLTWPVGGVNKRAPYVKQGPYTSPSALNVWTDDTLDERERGGSRAGLAKAFAQQISGGSNEVFLLPTGRYTATDGTEREVCVAVANGELWWTAVDGTMSQLSTNLSLADVQLSADWHRGKLYIADYGDVVAEGTDGAITSSTDFDSATYADWTAVSGLNQYDYVLEVLTAGTGATVGRYSIDSVSSGNLTVADSPGNATGITFRIRRGPKVFDPSAATLTLLTDDTQTVPGGCRIVVEWQDRVVWAADPYDANNWHASELGDATNYTVVDEATSAISGDSDNSAGKIGEPITALIPHSNNCLLLAGKRSMYVIRDNPSAGGGVSRLSHSIGVVSQFSWTYDKSDYLFFLSPDGIYWMPPGCGDAPLSISRELLPEELRDTDTDSISVVMEFDLIHRMVHVSQTVNSISGATVYSFDIARQGADHSPPASVAFWPSIFASAHQWFSSAKMPYTSDTIFGCRDGYIRKFSKTQETDDGSSITSFCVYGPIALGKIGRDGRLDELLVVTDTAGGDVDVDVIVATTAQGAASTIAVARSTHEFNTAGMNYWAYPRARGAFLCLKLKNGESGNQWAVEEVIIGRSDGGRRRVY